MATPPAEGKKMASLNLTQNFSVWILRENLILKGWGGGEGKTPSGERQIAWKWSRQIIGVDCLSISQKRANLHGWNFYHGRSGGRRNFYHSYTFDVSVTVWLEKTQLYNCVSSPNFPDYGPAFQPDWTEIICQRKPSLRKFTLEISRSSSAQNRSSKFLKIKL